VTPVYLQAKDDGRQHFARIASQVRTAMKILLSALIALSVLAGVAAPANAFDAKSLFGQLDREAGGGSNWRPKIGAGGKPPRSPMEATMNKLMSSSMLGLAPIAPSQTLDGNDEERPGVENDNISQPVIARMATREEIARIRQELEERDARSTKHTHWCSVLLRATWRRIHPKD
jgi:hypothetical protein